MSWNHRVTKRTIRDNTGDVVDVYEIREVHYSWRGGKLGWTRDAVGPYGESLGELRADYERMGQAFSLPVIDITDESNPVEV